MLLHQHACFGAKACWQQWVYLWAITIDPCGLQAFADILSSSETFSAPMEETYKMLDVDPSSITTLESYLQEYYTNIMKKLKQAGAQSRQSDFYV